VAGCVARFLIGACVRTGVCVCVCVCFVGKGMRDCLGKKIDAHAAPTRPHAGPLDVIKIRFQVQLEPIRTAQQVCFACVCERVCVRECVSVRMCACVCAHVHVYRQQLATSCVQLAYATGPLSACDTRSL